MTRITCPVLLGQLLTLAIGSTACSNQSYHDSLAGGAASPTAGSTADAGSGSLGGATGAAHAQGGASSGTAIHAGAAFGGSDTGTVSVVGTAGVSSGAGASSGSSMEMGGRATAGGAQSTGDTNLAGSATPWSGGVQSTGGTSFADSATHSNGDGTSFAGSATHSNSGGSGFLGTAMAGAGGTAGGPTLSTLRSWDFSNAEDLEGWSIAPESEPELGAAAEQSNLGAYCSTTGCATITTTFSVVGAPLYYEALIFYNPLSSTLDLSAATFTMNLKTSAAGFRQAHIAACDESGTCITSCDKPCELLAAGDALRIVFPASKVTTNTPADKSYCWVTTGFDPARVRSVRMTLIGGDAEAGPTSVWIDSVTITR